MRRTLPVLFLLIAFTSLLRGQESSNAWQFDIDHRSRLVYWDEGLFPGDGWVGMFSRHRTKIGATWQPLAEFEVRAVLANEFFSWYRHRNKPDFTLDEVFFDNLYLQWKPERLPLTVTAGRQNMMFGEGFMVMDGGPLDGSRSIYFNALRLDVRPSDGHEITLFGLHQPVQDDMLPTLGEKDRNLLEYRTDGAGIYYSGELSPEQGLDAYYIYTRGEGVGKWPVEDKWPVEELQHTLGLRSATEIADGWRFTGEAALQSGTEERVLSCVRENLSWAWYGYLTWTPLPIEKGSASVDAGMYQYSGGVVGVGCDAVSQEFIPVFARWPKWSESFIYTLVSLRGSVALWTNILAPFIRVRWPISEQVTVRGMLQHLRDSHQTIAADKAIGTLAILETTVDAGSGLTGHALLERMWFGDGIPDVRGYFWGRLELRYRFRF